VIARETGRRHATGDVLVYLDADCRAPVTWLERVERRFLANSDFHKPRHLYSWKTLLKSEKNWPAIKTALRRNVEIALTLFRKGDWAV
jgi:hypothetical protein